MCWYNGLLSWAFAPLSKDAPFRSDVALGLGGGGGGVEVSYLVWF